MSIPKLCLNMIVKDEAHIIKETLENVIKYGVDYYVISDTGSTDNTKEIIKEFFDVKGIAGEIYDDKWEDFGHNRSLAFQHAKGKSQYIWVIDADDLVVGNLYFPSDMNHDAYTLTYGKDFTYHRMQLFRNDRGINWKYEGVLHEYPVCDKPTYSKGHIEGNYHIDSRRLGARSQNPNKYLNDALTFEKDLLKNPDNERSMFYCAQSYFDHGQMSKDPQYYERAISWYKKRIAIGRWWEEVYYSYLRMGEAMDRLNMPWSEIEEVYIKGAKYSEDIELQQGGKKRRAETYNQIANHYNKVDRKDLSEKEVQRIIKRAYSFAKKASAIPFPEDCVLFVHKDVYDYRSKSEYAVASFNAKKFMESYRICRVLQDNPNIPENIRNFVNEHIKSITNYLDNVEKENCILYIGNRVLTRERNFMELLDELRLNYNIFIIGDRISPTVYRFPNVFHTTLEFINGVLRDIKVSMVILYDNLEFLLHNQHFKNTYTVLYHNNHFFGYYLNNGMRINIRNESYLNRLLEQVNKVFCKNELIAQTMTDMYHIKETLILKDNSRLFDKDRLKYKVRIDDYDIKLNGLEFELPEYAKMVRENDSNIVQKIHTDFF